MDFAYMSKTGSDALLIADVAENSRDAVTAGGAFADCVPEE